MKCANFMDQEAIDAALHKSNESMMEQDRHYGVKNPKPLYILGTLCCNECHDADNPDLMKDLFDKAKGGDSGFHRVCYKVAER